MKCSDVKEDLWLYAAGEMRPEPAREWESHLASCAGCARELQELRELIGNLPSAAKRTPEYWRSFTRNVLDRLREGDARPAPIWRPAPAFALGLVLALGGLGAYQYRSSQKRKAVGEAIAQLHVLQDLDILERDDFERLLSDEKI